MKKRLFYLLEFEELSLIMSLSALMKWIRDDVGSLERECPQTYKITPYWLTKQEWKALQIADF